MLAICSDNQVIGPDGLRSDPQNVVWPSDLWVGCSNGFDALWNDRSGLHFRCYGSRVVPQAGGFVCPSDTRFAKLLGATAGTNYIAQVSLPCALRGLVPAHATCQNTHAERLLSMLDRLHGMQLQTFLDLNQDLEAIQISPWIRLCSLALNAQFWLECQQPSEARGDADPIVSLNVSIKGSQPGSGTSGGGFGNGNGYDNNGRGNPSTNPSSSSRDTSGQGASMPSSATGSPPPAKKSGEMQK